MEVLQTIIFKENGKYHIGYSTDHGYFKTSNGAFGQRETYLEVISKQEFDAFKESSSPSRENGINQTQ